MSDTAKLNHCPKCNAPVPADAPQALCPKCVLAGAATATEHGKTFRATEHLPSTERVAVAFPQLEIIEPIGAGGMGIVYKARQPRLDRFVALKLLPEALARDPHFAERFNREARVLARLNHPNIVTVYDFGQNAGFCYLLMEFVDGVNLRQAMQAGRFSPAEALSIVPKICEALQYAHSESVLHRDIKPENILLDGKGRVKIADFGIAKLVGDRKLDVLLTGTGATLGTPHYMAPEQLEHPQEVDHRADIYSLGVVFYEMLTGELPIGRFAPPSQKTGVDSRVDDVVMRSLEKEREKRFQNAGDVKTDVDRITSADAVAAQLSAGVQTSRTSTNVGTASVPPLVTKPNGWSGKAIGGAALTALSLLLTVVALSGTLIAANTHPPERTVAFILLALGGGGLLLVGALGLSGFVFGCFGLRDIRRNGGSWRGTRTALFGVLAWPMLLMDAALTVAMWVMLMLLIRGWIRPQPPGVILMTLCWLAGLVLLDAAVVRRAKRWARGGESSSLSAMPPEKRWRRLALAATPAALLLAPLLIVLTPGFSERYSIAMINEPEFQNFEPAVPFFVPDPSVAQADPAAPQFRTAPAPFMAQAPTLQVTLTAVELLEPEADQGHWLAVDFAMHEAGKCELTFRTLVNGEPLEAMTRQSIFLKADPGKPVVEHQRIEWRMPDELSPDTRALLRKKVAAWLNTPVRVGPVAELLLVGEPVERLGVLSAHVAAKFNRPAPTYDR